MEAILEVRGLTKVYKNKRGIRNISFVVNKGDIYGFLGPNGAGKTTAMKAISGLLRPDSGSIRIFGASIDEDFERSMARVGCLIEKAEAYDYLSGYRNLEIAARFYKDVDKKRIDEVLDIVGLTKYGREKVSVYSLGMKQRLGLASAVLSRPGLVILDEPSNGLDIEGMVDIRNVIRRLSAEFGTTFFISSHLIHEMELTCSRVGIIYDGSLIAEGIVEDVLKTGISLEEYFIKKVTESREVEQ